MIPFIVRRLRQAQPPADSRKIAADTIRPGVADLARTPAPHQPIPARRCRARDRSTKARDQDLVALRSAEPHPNMAAEARRAPTDIDGDIEDRTRRHAQQLGLSEGW